jgi:hypothetical protein
VGTARAASTKSAQQIDIIDKFAKTSISLRAIQYAELTKRFYNLQAALRFDYIFCMEVKRNNACFAHSPFESSAF